MSWWVWLIISIYGTGIILDWLTVMSLAIDEDWKFSQLAWGLIWPVAIVYFAVFDNDIRGWFERHLG